MRVRSTGFRSTVAALTVGAATALLLVAVIGSAQAAPSTKIYDVTVRVKGTAGSGVLTLTLTNSSKSKQTLGSANLVAPVGVTPSGPVINPARTGWTAGLLPATATSGGTVTFRSTSNALAPGQSVSADVNIGISGCANATWNAFAKQSNDFSGTGNDFTLDGNTNLRPLGSFTVDPIGTEVDDPATPEVEHLFVPQVAIPDPPADVDIAALDVCGAAYANYGLVFGTGATLEPTGVPPTPPRLVNADISTIVWTSGTGAGAGTGSATVDPATGETETGDQLVVDDQFTDIAATSNQFDVVEKICTQFDSTCHWDNGNNKVHVDAQPPSDNDSLGIGFINDDSFDCAGGTDALGDTLVYVNPRDYDTGDTQSVTITYDKTLPGTSGPVTSFVVCISKDNGESWSDPILDCTTDPPTLTEAPCIQDRERVQGNLALTLFFDPNADPVPGAR